MEAFPASREADVVLRDGSTVRVRPVRAEDEAAVRSFLEHLSDESRIFRFFSGATDLATAARQTVEVDYSSTYGLVATRGDGQLVGHGAYFRESPESAEIAFAVSDELHGHGLATVLLAHLAEVAKENGISSFTAEVMPGNHRMIEVFRESGFPVEVASRYSMPAPPLSTVVTTEPAARRSWGSAHPRRLPRQSSARYG